MQSFCGQNARTNVAPFACDEARKFPNKLLIGDAEFTESQALTDVLMRAAINAAAKLDTGTTGKIFAIHSILNPQDQSAANTEAAVGEGVPIVLVEGKPKFTYNVEIGQDLFKRLRKFNKRTLRIFTYDDAGNLWGVKNSSGKFVGAEAVFFITGNTQQTASAPVSALITISYKSATSYHDDSFYVPVTLDDIEPEGLLDVNLRYVSNASNVYKIAVEAPTAQFANPINIAERYNAELVAGLFNARTGATYATTLAITSVAYDSTLKVMTVTFDSTAYTALGAGTAVIKLYLDPVADLEAADIPGVEGVPVYLDK